jgi:hypothetical protein
MLVACFFVALEWYIHKHVFGLGVCGDMIIIYDLANH